MVCASENPEAFSVLDKNEVDGVRVDIVGEYLVGEEFCVLFGRR